MLSGLRPFDTIRLHRLNMIIHVKSLKKEYKVKRPGGLVQDLFFPKFTSVSAVDDISFQIEKGESVALLGPNGAGKTTTMKMLTGLVYPTSGEISILGFYPFDRKKEFLQRIGLVMGNKTGLDWDLTPLQCFELIKKIYRVSDTLYRKRLTLLTEMLAVQDFLQVQVRKLSLGERMKMELIGSILHDPEILFLDEPTIGLDIISKQRIRDFLREVQKEFGVTLLLTSHDMDDVEKVSDRVMVINKGVKVYDNTLDHLINKYKKERYVKLLYNKKIDHVEGVGGSIIERNDNYILYKIPSNDLPHLLAKATEHEGLIDIEIQSTPLEEIIAGIYRRAAG
jgi:ABC-2 type transport system ATP-binding protein